MGTKGTRPSRLCPTCFQSSTTITVDVTIRYSCLQLRRQPRQSTDHEGFIAASIAVDRCEIRVIFARIHTSQHHRLCSSDNFVRSWRTLWWQPRLSNRYHDLIFSYLHQSPPETFGHPQTELFGDSTSPICFRVNLVR